MRRFVNWLARKEIKRLTKELSAERVENTRIGILNMRMRRG